MDDQEKRYEILVKSINEKTHYAMLEILSRLSTGIEYQDLSYQNSSNLNPLVFESALPTLDDVIGLQEVKDAFKDLADFNNTLSYYDIYGGKDEFPRGYILYGSPGTGKDHSVRALKGEAQKNGTRLQDVHVSPSTHGSAYINQFSLNIKKEYDKLVQQLKKKEIDIGILYLSEMETMGGTRDTRHKEDIKVTNTLNEIIDGPLANPHVFFIGSTNRLDAVDPALRRSGRLGLLHCPIPNKEELYDLFKYYKNFFQKKAIMKESYKKLNLKKLTEMGYEKRFTGADVKDIFRYTIKKMVKLLREIDGDDSNKNMSIVDKIPPIKQRDLEEMVKNFDMAKKEEDIHKKRVGFETN